MINDIDKKACAYFLQTMLCRLRGGGSRLSSDQLFDLMDAIHNVPEAFLDVPHMDIDNFTELYFNNYDRKWANRNCDKLGISLVELMQHSQKKARNGH